MRRWNRDKRHRCPECHAIWVYGPRYANTRLGLGKSRPLWWRVYTCYRCGAKFSGWGSRREKPTSLTEGWERVDDEVAAKVRAAMASKEIADPDVMSILLSGAVIDDGYQMWTKKEER